MALENPRWRQMQRADQSRLVGVKTDRNQIALEVLGLEDDAGARDRKLADPALAKAATDHDALGICPGLCLEETARHMRQLLREFLDGTMHQCRGVNVVADQRLVELALGDIGGGLLAERIVAIVLQRLAQAIQNLAERALGGAVAEKTVLVLQFEIKAVDVDRRQTGSAMAGDARGGDYVLSHLALIRVRCGTTALEPIGFMKEGE